jgi:hypothetical protein
MRDYADLRPVRRASYAAAQSVKRTHEAEAGERPGKIILHRPAK